MKNTRTAAALLCAGLVLGACADTAGDEAGGNASAGAPAVSFPDALVASAKTAALADAGGEEIGGTVTVYGVNGGNEAAIVKAAIAPFEEATGITVEYTGTQDLNAVVQTRVQSGNAPDVVDASDLSSMRGYAEQGKLKDLSELIGGDELKASYPQSLLDAASVDGTVYGAWSEVDNFMVWYDPKNYTGPTAPTSWQELQDFTTQQAAAGKTPWCSALSSGASSGFPGAQWIEAWFVKHYGAEKLQQWASGELAWTSPEVKAAFEAYGAVATDPKMVDGGPTNVLAAPITDNGAGLVSDPARCQVMLWGIYAGGLTLALDPQAQAGTDLDFYGVPAADPAYAADEVIGGHVAYAFNDTPQVRAFLKYWSSAEAQSLLVSTGQWTEANQQIDPATYTNPLLQKASTELLQGKNLTAGPAMAASPETGAAFYKGVVSYVQDPDSLDSVLTGIQATVGG